MLVRVGVCSGAGNTTLRIKRRRDHAAWVTELLMLWAHTYVLICTPSRGHFLQEAFLDQNPSRWYPCLCPALVPLKVMAQEEL